MLALAEIVGMYHITGGGIWDKLRLPPGIGAVLNNMLAPPKILTIMQDLSWPIPGLRITDWRAHSTFNGGIGYIAILKNEDDGKIFIEECGKDDIYAQKIGETTFSETGEIIITKSRFREGKKLSSLRPE